MAIERVASGDPMLTDQETYRRLYEESSDAIILLRDDGTIFDANHSALNMCGYARDDIVGRNIEELVDHDEFKSLSSRFAELWSGRSVVMEHSVRRKDGSLLFVEVAMKRVAPDVIQCIYRDVTGWKAIQSESQRKGKLLEEAERLAHVGAWEWDAITNRCTMSDEWLRLTGSIDPTPLLSDICPMAHPDDCDAIRKALDEALRNQTPYAIEHRIIRKNDGAERVVHSYGKVEKDESGKPVKMYGASLDVTDRKRIEDALRRSQQEHRLVFEHSPVGLVYADRSGRVTACNDKFLEIFSVAREAVIGLATLDVASEALKSALQSALAGKIGRFEGDYTSGISGKTTYLRVVAAPVLDEDGAVSGYTVIFEDFSEMKRTQHLLLQAEGVKAIADLTGGVAHNFNNLLQVVMGNASLALMNLETGDLTEVQASLEAILSSSTFAAETVRRLAEFSSLHMQPERPETEVFDLSEIALDAIHITRPFWKSRPEKRGAAVKLRPNLVNGSFVRGHRHQLLEVVVNLIRNAAEALLTGGEIDVHCGVEDNEVVLRVKDNGIGIPEQDLARVFTPFYTTKMDIGSGLSLATTRAVVDQHGGKIFFSSAEGVGTEFSVHLPPADEQPAVPVPVEKTRMPAQPLVILAIDDMEPVVTLLKKWLSKYGHEVLTALNGRDGLRILEETSVDLVICDLAMPEMNGWEVGRRIKESQSRRDGRTIPFILMTGWNDQADDKERIEESGVAAVVQKPLDINALVGVIQGMVGPDAAHGQGPSGTLTD